MHLFHRSSVRPVVALSVIALALAGGLLGTVAVEPLTGALDSSAFDLEPPPRPRQTAKALILLVTASCTTLLLGVALLVGLRKPTGVGRRTFIACSALGWLNCPLVLTTVALFEGKSASGAIFGGLCVGIFVAVPLGMLYGGVSLIAARRLRRQLDHPTLTAHFSALATVGLTVLGASGIGALVVMADGATHTAWVPPSLAALGVAFALASTIGRWRIRRALLDGRAGLSRVPLSSLGLAATDLMPLDDQVKPDAAHALVTFAGGAGDGAYRTGRQRIPLALVD